MMVVMSAENDFGLSTEQLKIIRNDYIDPVIHEKARFDADLMRICRDYIQPAADKASATRPLPTAFIHAIFVVAFNACRDAAERDADVPDAERVAYAIFMEIARSTLELHSISF
jgi:hypothetical protein